MPAELLHHHRLEPNTTVGVRGLALRHRRRGADRRDHRRPPRHPVGLFISEYAPLADSQASAGTDRPAGRHPEHLFGLWGFLFLAVPDRATVALAHHLSRWIPIFHDRPTAQPHRAPSSSPASSCHSWCIPIVASITRAVFAQTPPGEKEAALALGCHAVGHGPHRRAALRQGRHHRRLHARPRPCSGRDHRRHPDAAAGATRSRAISSQSGGGDHRRVHRPAGRWRSRSPSPGSWPPVWCSSSLPWPPT